MALDGTAFDLPDTSNSHYGNGSQVFDDPNG
jgi:hypothetical protein